MGVPDNGPIIVGVTWFVTFFSGGFLGLRLYAKVSRKQGLWWDDHILTVSWLILLAEAITTQVGQLLGFGKHTINIPVENLATIALGSSVVASISSFAATLSKISFGVTLLRLTTGPLRWFVWFLIITLFIIMIPSATLNWIQCSPREKAWDPSVEGVCWPASITINYGIFNAAWCTAADFALALIPWKLIWGLQLRLRDKLGVGIAMSCGILAGVCAVVKGVYLMQLRKKDFYYEGKDVTIWTVVETATAIVAASIPVLRVFFKDKVSSYNKSHSRSHRHSTTNNVPLSRLTRSRRSSHTVMVQSISKPRDGGWASLDAIEDGVEDGASQRSILRDVECGSEKGGIRVAEIEHKGIMQTSTVTVTSDVDERSEKGKSWIGAPP
ncbi:hypothetical protein DE146DRAFT_186479 [Phaeosphaeria sp. MPI-PUGE-AT-0046c]|nr:hypothetical protein DE146DRAFT_186479 [Phaeosphaeria sp. MPI-PUGE-AT-0046c]